MLFRSKVALVIGNKEYECEKLKGLFYPEQDAQDVADALCKLGFMVRIVIPISSMNVISMEY